MTTLFVGDTGVTIVLQILDQNATPVDISGATTLEIRLQSPDGSVVTKTATLTNTGTDGKLEFATAGSDLGVPGTYYAQAHVVDGGVDYSSSIHSFQVQDILQ